MELKYFIKKLLPSYRVGKILESKIAEMDKEIKDLDKEIKDLDRIINDNNHMLDDLLFRTDRNLHEIKCVGWQHLGRFLTYTAAMETSRFIIENMSTTKSFEDKFLLLDYALNQAREDGLILEFGVFKGETINFISKRVEPCTVYGFDSFEGLPENWRTGFEKGGFDAEGKMPEVNRNVRLIKGWFDKSLPGFLENNEKACSFIHIDCDLYSSTKCVFSLLKNRIKPGTVIVFDEYYNYPGWQNGEYKAFNEFIEQSGYRFEYIGYSMIEQVAVRIK